MPVLWLKREDKIMPFKSGWAIGGRRLPGGRALRVGIILASCGMATGLGLLVWDSYGEANRSARRTTLGVMRSMLVSYAQKTGRYPDRLQEVVREPDFPGAGMDAICYVAAGEPYHDARDRMLFYEKRARRYGFDRGYFVVHKRRIDFVPGDPVQYQSGDPHLRSSRGTPNYNQVFVMSRAALRSGSSDHLAGD